MNSSQISRLETYNLSLYSDRKSFCMLYVIAQRVMPQAAKLVAPRQSPFTIHTSLHCPPPSSTMNHQPFPPPPAPLGTPRSSLFAIPPPSRPSRHSALGALRYPRLPRHSTLFTLSYPPPLLPLSALHALRYCPPSPIPPFTIDYSQFPPPPAPLGTPRSSLIPSVPICIHPSVLICYRRYHECIVCRGKGSL